MDRNEEYTMLSTELTELPDALSTSEQRVMARLKREKIRRLTTTLSGAVMSVLIFILVVNVFPTAAYALGKIPFIAPLAKAVAFSPSLKAAVENKYVQPVELEQTVNGITCRIEYLITDPTQVNVFYTLTSADPMIADVEMIFEDDATEPRLTGTTNRMNELDDGLRGITLKLFNRFLPKKFKLKVSVYESSDSFNTAEHAETIQQAGFPVRDYKAEFVFDMDIDSRFISKSEIIMVHAPFEIDGQTIYLDRADIYPTHMRIRLSAAEENTAWLTGMRFYAENEKGERFEATGDTTNASKSPMIEWCALESSYFANSKTLTLYITGADWINKKNNLVKLDLVNVKSENIPEGVQFTSAERKGDDWHLTFTAKTEKAYEDYKLWNFDFIETPTKRSLREVRWFPGQFSRFDEETKAEIETPYEFQTKLILFDYKEDVVWYRPYRTKITELETPIALKIR